MAGYSLIFPEDFDEYEWEVTSKGWFDNARLNFSRKEYRLIFYDPVRLGQTIEDELQRGEAFFEPNLIVVRSGNPVRDGESSGALGAIWGNELADTRIVRAAPWRLSTH
jgi:hypothetical protein